MQEIKYSGSADIAAQMYVHMCSILMCDLIRRICFPRFSIAGVVIFSVAYFLSCTRFRPSPQWKLGLTDVATERLLLLLSEEGGA